MSISAIILSYNARHDLERCVRSLIDVEGFKPGADQIIIVDNGSTDGSKETIEHLSTMVPGLIDTTFLPTNLGTTASRNLGFAKARGDYLLVIDSDIYFQQPVLSPLIQQLAADRSIGIVAPKLIFPDGKSQMSTDIFPTIPRKLERFFRLRHLERQARSIQHLSQPVDYAISAFWLMRRELIDQIGPLDERIVYAPEDADFCLRVWLKGQRVVYRPELDVVHDAKERSRSLKSLLFTWRHICGLAYYFNKHQYAFKADKLYRRIGRLRTYGMVETVGAVGGFEGGARG